VSETHCGYLDAICWIAFRSWQPPTLEPINPYNGEETWKPQYGSTESEQLLEKWEKAEAELRHALALGRLQATAQTEAAALPRLVPQEVWTPEVQCFEDGTLWVTTADGRPHREQLFNVRLLRQDILAVWPDAGTPADSLPTKIGRLPRSGSFDADDEPLLSSKLRPPVDAIPVLGSILKYALLHPDKPSLLPDGSNRECLEQALVRWSMSGETPDLQYDQDLLNAAKRNIWEKLLSGDLQAWGRDGTPWGPWVKIPADAWFCGTSIG
jgi:hypothetical protein